MKSYISLLFLSLWFVGCTSRLKGKANSKKDSNIGSKVELDSNFAKGINKTPLEIFISDYADSLNKAKTFNELPIFLRNNNFDEMNEGVFQTSNVKIEFRKEIIDKVNNCTSLKLILQDKSGLYKIRPIKKDKNIESSSLSNFELAKRRYTLLHCK